MENNKQYSDSVRLACLLALVGGFLDAYTYICRGKVFANAQTGNMAMVGISAMEGNINDIIKYSIPILAFTLGIIIVETIRSKVNNDKIHWRQMVLLVEILLIVIVAFIPTGSFNYIVNTIVSLACALQVGAFRKFNGNPYATTMCTGNLRSGTESLLNYFKKKDKKILKTAFQYYFIIFIFCLGAFIGGIITVNFEEKAVLFTALPLLISLMIMGKEYKKGYLWNSCNGFKSI